MDVNALQVTGFNWVEILYKNWGVAVHLLNMIFSVLILLYLVTQHLFEFSMDIFTDIVLAVLELGTCGGLHGTDLYIY